MVHAYNLDGEPSPRAPALGPLSESPESESETWMSPRHAGGLSVDTEVCGLSMRRSAESISSDYKFTARSPLLEPDHGIYPSGLDRIRQQHPSRVLTLPNMSSASLTPMPARHQSPSPRSKSSSRAPSRAPSTSLSTRRSSAALEDLHRFPCESLHSFSFAQQSEELLHTRQNILKRSIDFMRDRFGWAASNSGIVSAQARISGDAEIQSMVDLLSRANVIDKENTIHHPGLAQGPITGPADVDGDNIFEKSFTDPPALAPEPHQENPLAQSTTSDTPFPMSPLTQDYVEHRRRELRSAPTSRRVSLKRTFTDLHTVSLRTKLMETLAQPYSAADPFSSMTSSTIGLGFPVPALHTHSSKWTPVSQAVFRTESQAPWTILAANDLSCLVFGVTQSEVRRLSIMEVVQKERRQWLESKLQDPSTDAAAKAQSHSDKSRAGPVNPRSLGLGNGVTAHLLSKPSSREKTNRRVQTDNGYGSSTRNGKNPNHAAHKSRGVLLCGDVVPIQKRNGTRGSASVWVMEKRGGLIWVLEEITENVADLTLDESGRVVAAYGDVNKIWGHQATTQAGKSVSELLPRVSTKLLEDNVERGIAAIAEMKYFAARTSSGVCIPTKVSKGGGSRELRVSSHPNIAGMMVLSASSLNVISSNSVFSAALFGQETPEGRHITELIPGFDELLHILTEEDKVPLVDGVVIPEHSFRRARTLSLLRDGKANAAAIFADPVGLPATHRDGSTIAIDVQLRVVKSGSMFPRDQDPTCETHAGNARGNVDDVPVTEVVYALWITFSKQIHAAGAPAHPSTNFDETPTYSYYESGTDDALEQQPPVETPSAVSISAPASGVETLKHSSSLTQQLSEAASEPLTDRPVQPMPEVKSATAKNEPPKKRTISDYVILEEMGQGAYGQVKLARLKRNPAKRMVLKYVTKKRILVDTWTRDRRLGTVPLEIHVLDFLRRDGLKHPNIVEMEGFFEDDVNYYIEMVPHGLPGMDLFDYIELKANMDESECLNIFKQVVGAIHHLHTKALVVHRDIKDENVILDGEGRIKLIDFGSAAYIKNGPFNVFVGTIDYAAPEVLQGKFYRGKEQDIWALGILLYTIVYKENPFYNVDEILDHPLRIPFVPFSEDCIDLIRKMLDRDVDNRLTISGVLEHPWMKGS